MSEKEYEIKASWSFKWGEQPPTYFDIEPTRVMYYEHLSRLEERNLPLLTFEEFLKQINSGDEAEEHF